jgi:hypothetical protein
MPAENDGNTCTKSDELLRRSFIAIEVNAEFSEATVVLRDRSKLDFCHRVGERWVRSADADGCDNPATLAAKILAAIAGFRLNAKHLEIQFSDSSSWEFRLPGRSAR